MLQIVRFRMHNQDLPVCFPTFSPFNAPHMERASLMTSVTNEAAGRSVRAPPRHPPCLGRASEPERSQPDENAEQVTSCCTLVVAPSLASLMFRYVCHASFNPLLLPNFLPKGLPSRRQKAAVAEAAAAVQCGHRECINVPQGRVSGL